MLSSSGTAMSLTTSTELLTVSMRWPRTSFTSHTTPSAGAVASSRRRVSGASGLKRGARDRSSSDEPRGRICTSVSGSYSSSPSSSVSAPLFCSSASLALSAGRDAWRGPSSRGDDLDEVGEAESSENAISLSSRRALGEDAACQSAAYSMAPGPGSSRARAICARRWCSHSASSAAPRAQKTKVRCVEPSSKENRVGAFG